MPDKIEESGTLKENVAALSPPPPKLFNEIDELLIVTDDAINCGIKSVLLQR